MGPDRGAQNLQHASAAEKAQGDVTEVCGQMKIPLALIKGALLGLALIGAVYFMKDCCGICLDAARHIPDILFGDYEIQPLPANFSVSFFGWLAMEAFLFLLLPNDHKPEDED
ncbi:hypothetical protein [Flavonifractor sp. An306]|uniref:hypothetical protein n=1 Tax=Flavonifractor sp. An306 TaxID=1965629 RepID=UPI001749C4CC|nr:hypothetical protein [Flavonifractor sp. An306]